MSISPENDSLIKLAEIEKVDERNEAVGRMAAFIVCSQPFAKQLVDGKHNTDSYRRSHLHRGMLTALRINIPIAEVISEATSEAMRVMEEHGWEMRPGESLSLPSEFEDYTEHLSVETRIVFGIDGQEAD